jgi:hypothetical protein
VFCCRCLFAFASIFFYTFFPVICGFYPSVFYFASSLVTGGISLARALCMIVVVSFCLFLLLFFDLDKATYTGGFSQTFSLLLYYPSLPLCLRVFLSLIVEGHTRSGLVDSSLFFLHFHFIHWCFFFFFLPLLALMVNLYSLTPTLFSLFLSFVPPV